MRRKNSAVMGTMLALQQPSPALIDLQPIEILGERGGDRTLDHLIKSFDWRHGATRTNQLLHRDINPTSGIDPYPRASKSLYACSPFVAGAVYMATRREKIGIRSAERIGPGETVWDTELKRFGMRRRADRISYVVKAQIDRRQRWITIGQHGPMTPAQARAAAKSMLGGIDAGQDPTRERDANRKLPTLGVLADRWLAEHVDIKRKASTAREYRRIVDLHIRPALGALRVDRIDRADVMSLHAKFATTRYAGNRVIAVLSALLSFAERLGYRQPGSNPVRGVERYTERTRKHPLSADELQRLWRHLDQPNDRESPHAIAALKLLILTGCRKSEVLTLLWSDVDLGAGILRLRDAKTGDRDVMLSALAVETLRTIPRIAGNHHVICGAREGARLVNLDDPWRRARDAVGLSSARIHDLRHSLASALARSAPMTVVRDALGHKQMQTTSGYSHAANDDVRRAVDGFAQLIIGDR